MAVGTDDAGLVHGALKKGIILEHLAVDLPVRVIKPRLQESRQCQIKKWGIWRQSSGEKLPS